ncbi:MAG: sugar transferase [Armatimonadota bacterium]
MAGTQAAERRGLPAAREWPGEAISLETAVAGEPSALYLGFKRACDIALSLLGIVLCLPLWALIALAIRLDSPGPVLFRQVRPGHRGVPFGILKFRTMYEDAEERLAEVLAYNKELDHSLIRIEDDPRVTRVGRWLRKFSLDETPQFVNVLRGEMSIVGPRPISRPIPDVRGLLRLEAMPGMTGLWQINGRKNTDCKHMLELDMRYLRERGVLLDLSIMLMTVWAVLRGTGAD